MIEVQDAAGEVANVRVVRNERWCRNHMRGVHERWCRNHMRGVHMSGGVEGALCRAEAHCFDGSCSAVGTCFVGAVGRCCGDVCC